jgi:formylglycine-generating enzyme required for sulfatase activity
MAGLLVPRGFWSYVRDDDVHERGRLSRLRERLEGEIGAQLGRHATIFQDLHAIRSGQDWERRLTELLDEASFFVPILTPAYFTSPACREEAEFFLARMRAMGRDDLVFPLYYLNVSGLDDKGMKAADSLMASLTRPNWLDWRSLRFRVDRSPTVKKQIAKFASDIIDALQRAEAAPPPIGSTSVGRASPEDALVRQVEALTAKIVELEKALEEERAARQRQELNAQIKSLIALAEKARRPLIQISDLFSHNDAPVISGIKVTISIEDVFGLSKPGGKLVEALVEGVKPLAEGIRNIALSDRTRKLVSDIVAGTRSLVRNVARHVRGKPGLDRAAESLDEAPSNDPLMSKETDDPPLEPLVVFHDRLKDGTAGPEMVVIPAGAFMMGSPESDREASGDEKPQRQVTIPRAFALARTLVTFEEYDRFCAVTTRELSSDSRWGRGNRPVINVTWHDAKAYCDWLGEETGAVYRLASEAEWEYACRAGTATRYWWGDAWDEAKASNGDRTTEVNDYPANPWGLRDMLGNVWEWCEDHYEGEVGKVPSDGSAHVRKRAPEDARRVARGGSWGSGPGVLRCAVRLGYVADGGDGGLGFRLARTL